MFVGDISQSDDTIGSFPDGLAMGSFGLIANPVYTTGPYAGDVVGNEVGLGTDTKLNIRQATKVQIRDDSGTGFRSYEFTGPGASIRSNLFIAGQKTLPVAGETITASAGASFAVEQVFQSDVQVGSGDILYIIQNEFNVQKETMYSARFIIPL